MSQTRVRSVTTILTFVAILIIAIWMRTWRIQTLPPGFHFDEAFEGLEAWRILTDAAYRPIFLTGNFGVPPLNAYANALSFWIFTRIGQPVGPLAMRLTAAMFGTLGVASIWALGRELAKLTTDHPAIRLSTAFPLFAAAVLALMRWHVHFSRMGIEPILVPLLWTLATWGLLFGWRTDRWWGFAICGLCLGLGMYAYQGAWITPFLMLPVVLHLIVVARPAPTDGENPPGPFHIPHLGGLLLAAAVALIVFAPLGWFFLNNSDWLLMRPTQLVIVGETSSPADSTVWSNIWRTAKMFGPLGTPGDLDPRRNVPGAPALNVWLALPFYGGLFLALRRALSPAYSIPLIGLVGLLLPGIFSEYAPHFHRILGASAPVALLCAIGLDAVWQWRPVRLPALHWLAALLIVLGGITAAWNYFGRWAALPDLFYAFDVGLWETGQWIADQRAEQTIFLSPRSSEHATLAFALRTLPAAPTPISFDGRHILPLTARPTERAEHYAVIEHEDFRTRLLLPGVLPDLIVAHEIQDAAGAPYARIYQRPSGTAPQYPPQHAHFYTLGDGIELLGYDAQPSTAAPGAVFYVQLHWLVSAPPTDDWTTFVQLVQTAPDGTETRVAGFDSPPGAGSLPTTRWQPGWLILDEYQIPLPEDLPAGDYTLRTGMYRNGDQGLLPLSEPVTLGSVRVEP